MTEATPQPQWRRIHLFFMIICLVIVVVNLLPRFNGYYIVDDAFMFARYADHLPATGHFSWDGSTPAYGATSLVYVFSLLPFRLLSPDNAAFALFLCSFFWGLVFFGLAFRLVGWEMKFPVHLRPLMTGLVWLVAATTARSMAQHFTSGMDTTLAMAFGAGYLITLKRLERAQNFRWAAIVGLMAGIGWWIRPDMLVFTLGIPVLAGLASQPAPRKWFLIAAGCGMAVFGLLLVAGKGITGYWLPHAFLAKSTGIYGPEFKQVYSGLAFAEFARYLSKAWPMLVLIGFSFWLSRQVRKATLTPLEVGILLSAVVFMVYHLFFVVPVMGFGQRFWFPLTPFLLLVAARVLLNLREHLSVYVGADIQKIWPKFDQWAIGILGLALLYYGIDGAMRLRKSKFDTELGIWDSRLAYQEKLADYWFRLDRFSDLPDDLVIATTEVGIPSALNPRKRIVDIAGLNEPTLLGVSGPTANEILGQFHPDVIYMPHNHYSRLVRSFAESKEFTETYFLLPAEDAHAAFGVAVRRESPHIEAMLEILN